MRRLALLLAYLATVAAASSFADPHAVDAAADAADAAVPPDTTDLEAGWHAPPPDCRPRTWYHVMSGNMTAAGLSRDFEAMRAAGLGGLLLFNITQGIPNGDVVYDSPEHHALLRYAAAEAQRLGLSFGVHNCDGWSSSGGPWVTPAQSMQMVVWTDTVVAGGAVDAQLPQPTTREGYYRDLATFAYPSLPAERASAQLRPMVTSSQAGFAVGRVTRGRWDAHDTLRAVGAYLQYDYAEPVTIRSVRALFKNRRTTLHLESSADGERFVPAVVDAHGSPVPLHKVRTAKDEWSVDARLPDGLTARHFRVVFSGRTELKQLELSPRLPPADLFGRTAMARVEVDNLHPIGDPGEGEVLNPTDLIDLTDRLGPGGRLRAVLPEGQAYTILRLGVTSTGARNHPASAEGRGLEVDKLSRAALRTHYDAFVGEVVGNVREVAPDALQYAEIDSYEMGGQNWTPGFGESFAAAKGYDLRPYLPLLAGRFVGDAATSERVLEDFRAHVGRLFRDNYFAYFTELCRADGIQSYIEPYGFGPFNDLAVGGVADLPMGEFWMNRDKGMIASAVSAAHTYGKPVVSAESFTSQPDVNWRGRPAMTKPSGDKAWAEGINEFMFHRFAHQANTHVLPGMTMNRWGFHMDGTQTWWRTDGRAWFDYIARGSYLLRQGRPVADLLVFVGDGTPTSYYARADLVPAVPNWIELDNVNAEVLAGAEAAAGRVTLRFADGGHSHPYRALVLPTAAPVTLSTARDLLRIAEAGVAVLGEVPKRLLGHGHSAADEAAFARTRARLATLVRPLNDWAELYAAEGWTPDLRIDGRDDIGYEHRRVGDRDVYFVYNPDDTARQFVVDLRTSGRVEQWDPLDGSIRPVSHYRANRSGVRVRIGLEAQGAAFLVSDPSSVQPGSSDPDLAWTEVYQPAHTVLSPWTVAFPARVGDTAVTHRLRLGSLGDWTSSALDPVRYFSGTATYRTRFRPRLNTTDAPPSHIELGEVGNSAELWVNGDSIGVSWMPPHRFPLSPTALARDTVELVVKVTNSWANRLIGDARYPEHFDGYAIDRVRNGNMTTARMPAWYKDNRPPPAGPRQTFTTADFYAADDPLEPSGLLGPVRLVRLRRLTDAGSGQLSPKRAGDDH